eukprot:74654-Hanusia_phi.AAC.1
MVSLGQEAAANARPAVFRQQPSAELQRPLVDVGDGAGSRLCSLPPHLQRDGPWRAARELEPRSRCSLAQSPGVGLDGAAGLDGWKEKLDDLESPLGPSQAAPAVSESVLGNPVVARGLRPEGHMPPIVGGVGDGDGRVELLVLEDRHVPRRRRLVPLDRHDNLLRRFSDAEAQGPPLEAFGQVRSRSMNRGHVRKPAMACG